MTPQDIFDTVAAHLYKQNKRSYKGNARMSGGFCVYRSPEGLKCAVGCLIPDEDYDPRMDDNECMRGGTYVSKLVDLAPELGFRLPAYFSANVALLASLQRAHDGADIVNADKTFNRAALKDKLQLVANDHNLKFTPPNA